MKDPSISHTRGITGNTLKIIAIVTMFLDHIGAAVIENGILKSQDTILAAAILNTPEGKLWSMTDMGLRTIGRLAFPIFCFLLVEGFLHTRDVKKYELRLLLFGLVSEIPFDLAVFGTWFYPGYQNVFFTLFIGLWVLERYRDAIGQPVKQSLVILAGCGAVTLLKCDYNVVGIILILFFYVFHDNKKLQTIFGGILAAIESLACFGAGMLAFIPIRMYNGTKGEKNLKYFFYWFYPVHLLFLYILRSACF